MGVLDGSMGWELLDGEKNGEKKDGGVAWLVDGRHLARYTNHEKVEKQPHLERR